MPENRSRTETEDRALIEAALFLSPQPLTRRSLSKILEDVQGAYVDRLLAELRQEYARDEHGLELCLEEGRAGFRVKKAFIDRVAHLAPQQDIPRPILRSLAVIAYNHPMTQADLVKVRGNKAYGHVQELIARRLIRAEESGRTLLLYVTKEFLRHFGLSTVEEFRFHVAGVSASDDDEEREASGPLHPETADAPRSEREPDVEAEPDADAAAPAPEGGG